MPDASRPSGPASSTMIEELGSRWLRRVATVRPAVPPPTMIYAWRQRVPSSPVFGTPPTKS